ncbi:HEAT repeat domain-containing protein [Streptomyces viridochromogenes]|nr:HEAT repeat domain-containing protein [Streptomyces viridochromogenes]ELS56155.1 putative AviX5 [Streptomyces viridochromogenes Tue57]
MATRRTTTPHIETLVQQLDGDDDASYAARAQLVDIGRDAILTIIGGLPTLGSFGRLTAIEVFEEVADPRCCPALIALLDADDPSVREWARGPDRTRRPPTSPRSSTTWPTTPK